MPGELGETPRRSDLSGGIQPSRGKSAQCVNNKFLNYIYWALVLCDFSEAFPILIDLRCWQLIL
jgi:hypothetical protein